MSQSQGDEVRDVAEKMKRQVAAVNAAATKEAATMAMRRNVQRTRRGGGKSVAVVRGRP